MGGASIHATARIASVLAGAAADTLGADTVVVGIREEPGWHMRVLDDRGRAPAARQQLAALIPSHTRPQGIVLVGRTHGGPFSPQERRFLNALAAIAALALDHLGTPSDRRAGSQVQLAGMQIDLAGQEVIFDDRHVHLTPSELRILLFLADEPGRARTRREILRHVWHTEHIGDERACDAHISNLRRKIERDPSRPRRVVTIRSVGYALRLPRIS